MKILGTVLLFVSGLSLLAAIPALAGNPVQDPTPPKPPDAPAPKPKEGPEENRSRNPNASLHMAGIPGLAKEKAAKQSEVITRWLTREFRRPIEVTPVADAAAAIEGLAADKFDMIWVDAISAVKAEEATKNRCASILARPQDLGLTTYWIASKRLVDDGTFRPVEERKPTAPEVLASYKSKLAGLKFGFGPRNSVGGHVIPRSVMEQAAVGIDPEKAFQAKPTYAGAGGDAGVLAAVASGALDLAVVGERTWEQASDEDKAKAPVVFVSPEYVDQSMLTSLRLGPTFRVRLIKAFITLDPAQEDEKPVLELFGTEKFIAVRGDHLDSLRGVIKGMLERKLLD